jgi:hypothetical protein
MSGFSSMAKTLIAQTVAQPANKKGNSVSEQLDNIQL